MSDKASRSMDGTVKIVDNVFVKMIHLNGIGDNVHGHAHKFDHITLLAIGSVKMLCKNTEKNYTAPCLIVTPKNIVHEFISLEDKAILCCIHAIRNGDEMEDVAPQDITEKEALSLLTTYNLLNEIT